MQKESASALNHSDECIKSPRIGYIYTGDSRIRRLNLTINIKGMKDNWVVCRSGMGYGWFVNYGLPEINRIIREKTYIDKWVIVSGWGVNDLWNSSKYIGKYTSLMNGAWKTCDLHIMSVNPVNGSKVAKYRSVDSFNSKIREYVSRGGDNISYIDTNSVMKSNGFSTLDGLHYSEGTNRLIYKTVREKLDEMYSSINYESITMNINSTRKLKFKYNNGRVKWKTGDSNVVRITGTGGRYNESITLTGVSEGSTVITAYCGGREFECNVNVVDDNILIAYFSYSGEVERVAEYIQGKIGGELVWIDRKEVYPYTDGKLLRVIDRELASDARPELDSYSYVDNISDYSCIYLGYPLWSGYAPRPVCTFFDMHDMSGAVINPFVVSKAMDVEADLQPDMVDKEEMYDKMNEEAEQSIKELRKMEPGAVFDEPVVIDGDRVLKKRLRKEINRWL